MRHAPAPAAKHAELRPMFDRYFERVEAQEGELIEHGYPADGLAAFLRRYLDAWNYRDLDDIADCYAQDIVWTGSPTWGYEFTGQKLTMDVCRLTLKVCPEFGFYPWDGTDASLPYFDFTGGVVRITLPWFAFCRVAWPKPLPKLLRVGPIGRVICSTGHDRYFMDREDGDWRISRIDADGDLSQWIAQILPIPLPASVTARPMATDQQPTSRRSAVAA